MVSSSWGDEWGARGTHSVHYSPAYGSLHCAAQICSGSSSFGTLLGLFLRELKRKVNGVNCLSLSCSWSQSYKCYSPPSTTHSEVPSLWLGTSAGLGSLPDRDPNPHP